MIQPETYEWMSDIHDALIRIAEAAERIADEIAPQMSEEDREMFARVEEEKRKLQADIDEIRLLEERERNER